MTMTTARPKPALDPATEIFDRIPPNDTAAEAGVLGSMILDPECIAGVLAILPSPDYFYKDEHQTLFRVLVQINERQSALDGMIVWSELKTQELTEAVGGREYFAEILNSVPTSANAEYYAATVREKAIIRRVISASAQTLREAYNWTSPASDLVETVERRIFDVAQQKLSRSATSLRDVLSEVFESMDRTGAEHLTGVPTGFIELDNLLSGMQRGEMLVLAARPSVGKTAFAMNIVEHVGGKLKLPCAVFSVEMSKQQLGQRMLASASAVDSHRMRRGMMTHEDRGRIAHAVGELSQAPIYIDDTPSLSITDLRTKARRMKLQYGIELLVVDYLQLMEAAGKSENRQQEVSMISRGIKAIARELKIPVLALSQLNRSSESEQRLPRTSDLRESGAIEQDADVIIFLHREAVLHRGDEEWLAANPDKVNEALAIVAKQRNGPCDTVKLTYIGAATRFANWNPGV